MSVRTRNVQTMSIAHKTRLIASAMVLGVVGAATACSAGSAAQPACHEARCAQVAPAEPSGGVRLLSGTAPVVAAPRGTGFSASWVAPDDRDGQTRRQVLTATGALVGKHNALPVTPAEFARLDGVEGDAPTAFTDVDWSLASCVSIRGLVTVGKGVDVAVAVQGSGGADSTQLSLFQVAGAVGSRVATVRNGSSTTAVLLVPAGSAPVIAPKQDFTVERAPWKRFGIDLVAITGPGDAPLTVTVKDATGQSSDVFGTAKLATLNAATAD